MSVNPSSLRSRLATRGVAIPLAGAVLALPCGLAVATLDPMLVVWLVVATSCVALAFVLLVHRSWAFTSPAIIIAGTYAALSLLAPAVLPRVRTAGAVSALLSLSSVDSRRTGLLFGVAALFVLVGAAAHELTTTLKSGRPTLARLVVKLRHPLGILVLTAVPALLLIAGVGPGYLVEKEQYLSFAGGRELVSLGTALSLPAVALTSCVLFSAELRRDRGIALVVVLVYAGIFFSLASRQLPMLPILVLAGWLLSDHQEEARWPRVLVATCATVILFSLPLALRSLPTHGVRPYIAHIASTPRLLVSPRIAPLANNILFSFPLTGRVGYSELPIPKAIFWIMVDPRLGTASGWEKVSPTQRIDVATPFNAMGQLANFGWPYLAGYLTVIGWYFAHIQHLVRRRFPVSLRPLAQTATLGIAGIFTVTSLQYSLRTASRLVYYAMVLELCGRAYSHWHDHRRKSLPVRGSGLAPSPSGMRADG